MLLSTRVKLAVTLWFGAEVLAFLLVAGWIGVGDAILVGVVTSLFGYSLLRRAGASALTKLRARLDGTRASAAGDGHVFLDETLATVGAVALIVPGFLSDLVGLALAAPAVRAGIAGRLRRRGATPWPPAGTAPAGRESHAPPTIDLEPDEWRSGDPARRPVPEA